MTGPGISRGPDIRNRNLGTVLTYLHRHGASSRSAITRETALTRSTTRMLMRQLAELGFVEERLGTADGSAGRPSMTACPVPESAAVLSVDIGAETVRVGLVGLGGLVLAVERSEGLPDRHDPERTLIAIEALARSLVRTNGTPITGIAVSVAAIVRAHDGLIVYAPNLGWRGFPLGDWLRTHVSADLPIATINDADAGALAEFRRGGGSAVTDLLYLSGDVGVGGGIVTNGRIFRGANGHSGIVGHMVVDPAGKRCVCGSAGCWQTVIGEEAFLRLAGLPPQAGTEGVDSIIAAAQDGNPEALRAIHELEYWLALGLGNLSNILDPERIVLGGLYHRLYPYLVPSLGQKVKELLINDEEASPVIVPAALGANASVIGAAEIVWDTVLSDVASFLFPARSL